MKRSEPRFNINTASLYDIEFIKRSITYDKERADRMGGYGGVPLNDQILAYVATRKFPGINLKERKVDVHV